MKNCKNCGIEIEEHRTYCSYKCRNIYVNTHKRNYDKMSNSFKKKFQDKYYENPKRCIICNEIIPYKKRENIYCGHSCAAGHTNKNKVGLKYNLSEEGHKGLIEGVRKRHKDKIDEYNNNPKKCLNCDNNLSYNNKRRVFCDKNCKNEYYRKNRTALQNYSNDCQFNFSLNDYPNEFEFNLIKKYGWYLAKNHGNNLGGISRDHMFSINEGFKMKISSNIIKHPANCKLMIHNDNATKWNGCSITIDELKERIKIWNEKYQE